MCHLNAVVSAKRRGPQAREASPSELKVGVADMAVTQERHRFITTYALGSCIGLTIYDPEALVGGMLHLMLPHPPAHSAKEQHNPAMYATIGVPALFKQVYSLGGAKERLIICLAGGAEIMSRMGAFDVARRNLAKIYEMFDHAGVMVDAEMTGGTHPRSMCLDMADGTVVLTSRGEETILWPT